MSLDRSLRCRDSRYSAEPLKKMRPKILAAPEKDYKIEGDKGNEE